MRSEGNRSLPGDRRVHGRRAWLLVSGVALALAGMGWIVHLRMRPQLQRVDRVEYAPLRAPLAFPLSVQEAPAAVRDIYEFAARRPDVLRYVPCFCGCRSEGHRSGYDCFIDEVRSDGVVAIDEMGFT